MTAPLRSLSALLLGLCLFLAAQQAQAFNYSRAHTIYPPALTHSNNSRLVFTSEAKNNDARRLPTRWILRAKDLADRIENAHMKESLRTLGNSPFKTKFAAEGMAAIDHILKDPNKAVLLVVRRRGESTGKFWAISKSTEFGQNNYKDLRKEVHSLMREPGGKVFVHYLGVRSKDVPNLYSRR